MSRSCHFSQCEIHVAPGFAPQTFPPIKGLSEGLNVVYGPNGVGKSTLVRSLRSLLNSTEYQKAIEAEGVLKAEDETWSLSLSQGKLVQKRLSNNLETKIPGRDDTFAQAYWFPLHELLSQQAMEGEQFLQEIHRQMQGGVDLTKALTESKVQYFFSSSRISESTNLKEAKKQVHELQQKFIEHAFLHSEIEELARQVEEGNRLYEKKNLFTHVQEYQRIAFELSQLVDKLALYDERLGAMQPTTTDRIKEVGQEVEEAKDSLDEAMQRRNQQERTFMQYDIPPALLDDKSIIESLRQKMEDVRQVRQQRDQAQNEYKRAVAALESWEAEHAWLVEQLPSKDKLQQMVGRLASLAQVSEQLSSEVESKKELVRALGEIEQVDETVLEQKRTRKVHLSQAFAAAAKVEAIPQKRTRHLGKLALAFTLAFAFAIAWIGYPIGAVVGLLGLSVVLVFFSREQENPAYRQAKEALEAALQTLGEYREELAGETTQALTDAYKATLEQIATFEQKLFVNRQRQLANTALTKAIQAYDAWLSDRKTAASDLGLCSNTSMESAPFFHFSKQLLLWHAAMEKKQEAYALLQLAEQRSDALEAQLGEAVDMKEGESKDVISLAASLCSRIEHARTAREILAGIQDECRLLSEKKEQKEQQYASLFQALRLETDDMETLYALQQNVAEYQSLKLSIATRTQQLAGYPTEVQDFASSQKSEAIQQNLNQLSSQIDSLQKTTELLGGKRKEYEQLCSSTELEQAEYRMEKATDVLEKRRKVEVQGLVLAKLAEEIQHQTQTLYQPQVLSKAGSYLKQITANRYTLAVGEKGFFATDLTQSKNYTLDELSSGTKVQLLFALRMAFLQMVESSSDGYRLPVFFDELMANSDDERSLAIAQAIVEISKQRQVFYCTAQQDEVDKLKRNALEEVNVIPLEDERRGYRAQLSPLRPTERTIYSPVEFNEDYLAYGVSCKVESPELFDQIAGLSSWYLCVASKEFEQLFKRGLFQAGQACLSSEVYERRYTLLGKAQALAQKGRMRILDQAVLEESELKLNRTAAFYQSILDYVAKGGVTGLDLLQAIDAKEIKRVNEAARSELIRYLYEQGYASDEQAYTEQEILTLLHAQEPSLLLDSVEHQVIERYLKTVLA